MHIGSPFFRDREFLAFLDRLPADATLVLNGDTVDRKYRRAQAGEHPLLRRLADESLRRRVVWISGNHEVRFLRQGLGKIEFSSCYAIPGRLFVSHGHTFDSLKRRGVVLFLLFRIFHLLRICLGAEPMHVALYAKKWPRLYGVLRGHVARNAVRYAKAHGYPAVACGHMHYAEDVMMDGVRYINSGSWTECDPRFILVDGDRTELVRSEPVGSAAQASAGMKGE